MMLRNVPIINTYAGLIFFVHTSTQVLRAGETFFFFFFMKQEWKSTTNHQQLKNEAPLN